MSLLRFESVEFDHGRSDYGLSVADLSIERGQRIAIVGYSGAGKTSLLRLAAGLLLPRSGQIAFDGTSLSTLSDAARRNLRSRRYGLVLQEFELLEHLSVLDNIQLPYRVNRQLELNAAVRARAAALATQIGIGGKLSRYPNELSQGERQRVAICRAALSSPDLLLADEPTGNLDATTAQEALQLILETAAETEAALLMVTHDLSLLPHFDAVIRVEQIARVAGSWRAEFELRSSSPSSAADSAKTS